jgi:hypothetical protein
MVFQVPSSSLRFLDGAFDRNCRFGHHALPTSLAVLLYGPQHFTDSIDTDGEHQEVDAMHESDDVAENQPRLAADDVETHGAQNEKIVL